MLLITSFNKEVNNQPRDAHKNKDTDRAVALQPPAPSNFNFFYLLCNLLALLCLIPNVQGIRQQFLVNSVIVFCKHLDVFASDYFGLVRYLLRLAHFVSLHVALALLQKSV